MESFANIRVRNTAQRATDEGAIMNNKNMTTKNPKNIKRRSFYGVLAGAVAAVLSSLNLGPIFSNKTQQPEVKVSLHPEAVSREKRG